MDNMYLSDLAHRYNDQYNKYLLINWIAVCMKGTETVH